MEHSPISENELKGLNVAIDLMYQAFERQRSNISSFRDTFRSLLSASSIAITMVGALALIGVEPAPKWEPVLFIGLVVAMGLYVAHVAICLSGLAPIDYFGPIEARYELLYDTFAETEPVFAAKTLLNQYLGAMENNNPIVLRMARQVRLAGMTLAGAILVLLALSIVPRYIIQ